MGNVDVLKKLLEWAKWRLTADELKQKLFLAKHLMGKTNWYDFDWRTMQSCLIYSGSGVKRN